MRRGAVDMSEEPSGMCDHYRETHCRIGTIFSFVVEKDGEFGHFAYRLMDRNDYGFFIFQQGSQMISAVCYKNSCMKNQDEIIDPGSQVVAELRSRPPAEGCPWLLEAGARPAPSSKSESLPLSDNKVYFNL